MTDAQPADAQPADDAIGTTEEPQAPQEPHPTAGAPEGDAVDTTDAFGEETDETPFEIRRAVVTLLTSRFITRVDDPETWTTVTRHEAEIRSRLDDLFLTLIVDHDYDVAFKRQNGEDGVPILLRRESRLSRDASFLLIFLRREHAFTDALDEPLVIDRGQVVEFLSRFHDDAAKDEVKSDARAGRALAALERLKLVTELPDDPASFLVSPAVVPLVSTNELAHFEQLFLEAAASPRPADADESTDDTDPEGSEPDDAAADEAESDDKDPDDDDEETPVIGDEVLL
jgi:hypothetical protein